MANTPDALPGVCAILHPHLVSYEEQSASRGQLPFWFPSYLRSNKNTGRREASPGWIPYNRCAPTPTATQPRLLGSTGLPSSLLQPLEGAPAPLLPAAGFPSPSTTEPSAAKEVDLLVHVRTVEPRVGAGGRRLLALRLHCSW